MDIDKLKLRFVDDLKIPITVVQDPYWDFYLDLYEPELKSRTLWNKLLNGIKEEYNDNPQLFLDDFYKLREALIVAVKETQGYNDFLKAKLQDHYDSKMFPFSGVQKNDIYNEQWTGKHFISIDLKKANIQALNYYCPEIFNVGLLGREHSNITSLYESWLAKFLGGKKTLGWYVPMSKYIRQVVFGNCKPERQITIERWLVGKAAEEVLALLRENNIKSEVVEFGSDEVVIYLPDGELLDPSMFESLRNTLSTTPIDSSDILSQPVDVKIMPFNLSTITYLTPGGHTVRIYKKSYPDGTCEYKTINKFWHAQIYEDLHGLQPDPDDKDLVFYQEKEVAKFLGRLKRV